MARIPQERLDELKQNVDLVALVQAHDVKLKRSGKNWMGCCPFHDDKTPSLSVTPAKHLWNCLGCDAGGDAIQWVMKADKVSFRRAYEILNEKYSGAQANVAQKPSTLETPVDLGAEGQQLLHQVVDYYHARLLETPAAMEYLQGRGIADREAITRFKIGFSDRTLGMRLPLKQVKAGKQIREQLQQLGIYRETGHEHFNGSVVFPIFDTEGQIVEMYGRKIIDRLRKGTPKHLYLPGPHAGVWNMEQPESLGADLIICESIIDALTFWCGGYRNVTTSYGTNGFTGEHLAAFERHSVKRIFIAYDNDEGGNAKAEELAQSLMQNGYEVSRIQFPAGMDANEYASKVKSGNGGAQQSLGLVINSAQWLGKGETTAETSSEAAKEESSNATQPESNESRKPSCDVDASVTANETVIELGNRRYRVRGLERNLAFDQLKINLLVSKGELLHVDTFDLYAARPRAAFAKVAAMELNIEENIIRKDLGKILLKLEQLQDEQIAATLAKEEKTPTLTDDDKASALELLRSPKLLQRIIDDFAACGVVGETTNKLVGYLATVSRKLEQPLAIVIQSSSAAGKSSLMEAVLALVPDEDVIKYSAMTGQSLFYMGETNLKYKILAIAEEEGAEQASYALKLLQSEGELTIASTGKDATTGRMETQQYRVEGPVMIFLTTTAIDVDEELMNRCIVLTVDENREQTRAIHERQRLAQTLAGLLSKHERTAILQLHRNAQRLLRPLLVVNPFAEKLTFLDTQTRSRRDHMKYLTLIRTIALLHQYQRPLQTTECQGETIQYIEATAEDIAMANRLADQVLGRSIDELPPQTRRLLMLLDDMVRKECERLKVDRSDYRFTRRAVREQTGLGNTQLKIHFSRLVEMEYLLIHRGGRGQSFVYELLYDGRGKEGQPVLPGLIDVTKLGEKNDYDSQRSESGANRSGQNGKRSGSGRPKVGAKSASGRKPKNAVNRLKPGKNGKPDTQPA